MANWNTAQIIGKANEILGRTISDAEAQQIMNATSGGDPGQVEAYLRGMIPSSDTGMFYGTPGGAVPGGTQYPPFEFDYEAAEREALEKLTPYYQKKLEEAQFDVDRAKRLIEEDYARGKRYREEDLTLEQRKMALENPEEFENLVTALNQRGRLFGEITEPGVSKAPYSGYAQERIGRLEEQQDLRRLAVERALQRQGEIDSINRARDIEEQEIAFPRYKSALEEEKKEKAVLQMVPLKREQEYNKWLATVGKYMQGG